ncbi:MAG: HD domain-containing protein [Candidatus Omnitrophica bacterium]|nr:HD domain-containing protein [Candidatus Omnitrophota bacterium]
MEKERNDWIKSSYLLRMFNLSFAVFTMLPMLVFLYLFSKYNGSDAIAISKSHLSSLVSIIAVASLLLFVLLGKLLRKITILTYGMRKALFGKIDTDVISKLAKEDGEVAQLAQSFEDIMMRLEDNIKDLQETKKTLHDVLSKVGKALTSMENFDLLINLILETAIDALGSVKGAIFSLEGGKDFKLKAAVGLDSISQREMLENVKPLMDETIRGQESIIDSEAGSCGQQLFPRPLVSTPLVCHQKTQGVIILSGKKKEGNFTEDELTMLANLSYQVAISFENAALSKDVEKTYFETMAALALAVEAKDSYSRGHSERVGDYAVKIAQELTMKEKEITTLKDASRLHDIGKIGIADKILNKNDALSSEEKDIMRKHSLIGESIVYPLKTFSHLLEPIRHHHEFLDGTGYPDGVSGDKLPLVTRVLTVADIFDALSSDRVYRKALGINKIVDELKEMVAQGKLDGKVVDALAKVVGDKKIKL